LKNIIAISLLLYTSVLCAQSTKIDSLKLFLNVAQSKIEIATTNLQLAKLYERIDINESKKYARRALENSKTDSLSAEINIQLGRVYFFMTQLDSAIYYFEKSKNHFKKVNNQQQIAQINISLGAITLRQGKYNKTIKTLTECASFFEKTNDSLNSAKCYSNIASALAELEDYKKAIWYSEKALVIFSKHKLTKYQLITLPNLAAQYLKSGDTIKAIIYNEEAEKLALKSSNNRSLSIIYNNLGSIYLDKNTKKSKSYLEKTIKLKNDLNLKSGIEVTQGNLGYIHFKDKEYQKAIYYYKLVSQQVNGKRLAFAYQKLKGCYNELNDYENAFKFSEKYTILNDRILKIENQKNFNEIQTKYETEKKEKEIVKLKTENLIVNYKKNKNIKLLFGVTIILVITLLLMFILYKNAQKKRLIIKQQHKIKTQDFEKYIKIQEINGIDAIIDAQDKERSRIADDLHDNLGSKIATLKLYIEEIKFTTKKAERNLLFNKLKTLVNDTYNEVRKIAHNKNFGALIDKGLILSTINIANQISTSEKLLIKVININVKQHINNAIEIQLFRIIQELLTNIIKYANATEVIIQFSEDTHELSIIIEDNGIGFNTNKKNYGFGLSNIEKRVEKIKGSISIDSTIGNGTTIIINVPL